MASEPSSASEVGKRTSMVSKPVIMARAERTPACSTLDRPDEQPARVTRSNATASAMTGMIMIWMSTDMYHHCGPGWRSGRPR